MAEAAQDNAIPAATIILLRDAPQFQALMVERHQGIAFAGGALVFPGGRIEASDADPRWAGHCDGLGDAPPEQRAPRIAAIREAFEETGLLLARQDGNPCAGAQAAALHDMRAIVERDDTAFLPMVEAHGLRLAADLLHLFARWRPPAGVAHRRYDTWFFAAAAPPDQTAHADGGEATEIVWTTPHAALDAAREGRRRMIFPTARNVELLAMSGSADDVRAHAAARSIRLVEPRIEMCDDGAWLTIPDDLGYPVTRERLETAMRA